MAAKEKDPKIIEPAVDAQAGSAADVEEIMCKYDRESNTRIWEGKPKIFVGIILAVFSLFCIYVTLLPILWSRFASAPFWALLSSSAF